jgi:hypothetical protein
MAIRGRRVHYFHTTVGEGAYDLLSVLAGLGVNLLAMNAVPLGPDSTQLTLFPEDPLILQNAAARAGLKLEGPHRALLVWGDDRMGALADIHAKLRDAHVDVFSSTCVTVGTGYYGYVIHVRPKDADTAAVALGL